jgi:hypothetical protein
LCSPPPKDEYLQPYLWVPWACPIQFCFFVPWERWLGSCEGIFNILEVFKWYRKRRWFGFDQEMIV